MLLNYKKRNLHVLTFTVLSALLILMEVSRAKRMNKIVFRRSGLDSFNEKDQYFDINGKHELNEVVIRMRLNQKYEISCPSSPNKHLSFNYMLFNNSIYNANEYYFYHDNYRDELDLVDLDSRMFLNIKSKPIFDKIFDRTEIISNENLFEIDRVNLKNSGRYYCVYSYFDGITKNYFVYNHLNLAFDEKVVFAKFNDTIQLAPMNYEETIADEEDHFEWFYDDKTHSLHSYLSLNEETHELIIQLKDMRLFDIRFRSQNTLNGAYLDYIIECTDCQKFSHAPILTPLKQTATIGSDILFTCDKPSNSEEPLRYVWYIKINDFQHNYLHNSNGQILKLSNVNSTSSGWYMCCIIYAVTSFSSNYDYYQDENNNASNDQIKNYFKLNNMTCSTAQLIVNDLNLSDNETITKDKNNTNNIQLNSKTHLSNIIILYLAIFLMLFFIVFFIFSFNFKLTQRRLIQHNNTNDIADSFLKNNKNRYQFSFNKEAQALNIETAKISTQFNLDP